MAGPKLLAGKNRRVIEDVYPLAQLSLQESQSAERHLESGRRQQMVGGELAVIALQGA